MILHVPYIHFFYIAVHMQRAGQLLAILLAAILSMSALASTIIPAATVFPAFAEEHDGEDDDNSGEGSGDDESEDESEDESDDESEDEMEDEEDDDNSGQGSGGDESEDETEDESEDEEDDNSDETEDEHEEAEDETEDEEDDDDRRVEEHRKDRAEEAEHKVDEIKERILNAEPASPGPVVPGLNYTLIAAGVTDEETMQDAAVDLELLSWKSTPAVAILAVVGGDVEVGDTDYTVLIGYAIYSLNHDAVRINALAVDEASGDVIKITLRGGAAEDAGFPDASGESVDLHFEGSSGPQKNEIADIDVSLDGTLEAE
jgi:hypothetical protein